MKVMKEKINLYLDDLRDCPEGFVVARNMQEAISYLTTHHVHILSLDHDLGLDAEGKLAPAGTDFVKYFCEHGLFADRIYIHTDNGPGREYMYQTLLAAQRREFISKKIAIYHYSITKNTYSDEKN
jgi:hypothetical protein